jgi:uncharacterized protein YcgI (DUF1989 family)
MRQRMIAPQTGVGFTLEKGDVLRVIDPLGEQVSDLIAFSRADVDEWLSSGRTFDYNNTIYLTTGHVLYSNRSVPMLTITADSVGRHDFLYTPCSQETFSIIYKVHAHHPSCLANLAGALHAFGVRPDRIPTTFNIFMNVAVGEDGTLTIAPPRSKAGDAITLRAEMDLVVALTACAAEMSNNYRFKPIAFEVIPATQPAAGVATADQRA